MSHFRLGDGLLISHGDKWRSHRKLIAPAFHQLVLKSFVGAFNRNSLRLVDRLEKEVGRSEFDVHDYMSEVTVDILLGNDKDIVVHSNLHFKRIKISLVQLFFHFTISKFIHIEIGMYDNQFRLFSLQLFIFSSFSFRHFVLYELCVRRRYNRNGNGSSENT